MAESRIASIASYLPERVLGNDELAALYQGWTPEKVYQKTGILERRVVSEGETACDLAERAARRLFEAGQVDPASIDFLLLCTQAPDYFLPTTACVLQHRLGLPTTCGALDINLGCSGFVYGLSLAKGLIASGSASRVLLVTADTYSRFIHPLDKSVRTLFGDGAAATLIVATSDDNPAMGPFVFGTDGSGAANLIVPTGGMRHARSPESGVETTDTSGNIRSRDNLFMDGAAIMAFTLSAVPKACAEIEKRSGIALADFDLVVFHQANRYMLETLRRKIGIAAERFVVSMERCGNTVSSSIPLALEPFMGDPEHPGQRKILLVGFGVGYSWAASVVRL